MLRLCRDQATAIYRASWLALLLAMLATTLEPTLAQSPPTVTGIESNEAGDTVTITFSESLASIDWFSNQQIAAFTFTTTSGSTPAVNDGEVTGATLKLTLSTGKGLTEGATVTLSYNPSGLDSTEKLKSSADGTLVAAWSSQAVTNKTDQAPKLQSVTALWDQITLTYNETLNEDSVPDKSDFTINDKPYAVTIDSVAVSGKTVTLTTSYVIRGNLSPQFQLSYVAPDTSPLQQADGTKDAPNFNSQPVVSSTPTTKPVVQSAAVNGTTLTITFDLPLQNVANASAFTVGGVTGVSISSTSYSGKVVTLTLSSAVSASDTVTIAYTKPNEPPRVEARNTKDADSFSAKSVTNNTVNPAPTFSSASINTAGDTLTITMSKDLLATTAGVPAKSAFTISGGATAITAVAVSGKTVTLTLSPKADHGETITIAYTKPTSANDGKLQSKTGGHSVASWTAQSVTNGADGKPHPISATVNGTALTITFDRALDTTSKPAATDFSLGGTTATVSSVAISGSTVTLTLSAAVAHDDTITVTYIKPSVSGLKRSGKAIYVDSFTTLSVTNNTPDPTPTFASASINPAGNTLVITMSKNLLTTTAGTAAKSAFAISGGTVAITAVVVSGKTVTLTLSPKADHDQTITIAYTKPTGADDGKLQSSTGGHLVASWSAQSVTNNADGKPRPTSATANGATLAITFDRVLDTTSKPAASSFAIGGTTVTASSVAISGSTATLTLSAAVAHDATITVTYTKPGSSGIKRSSKSIYADSFTALSMTNNTPDPPPTFSSASINTSGGMLTITMSKNLLTTTDGIPSKSAFTLSGGSAAISAVSISGKTVTLNLSPKADQGETITVAYTKPTGANDGKLQSSTGGHLVASWSARSVTNNADGKPRPTAAAVNGTTLAITFDRALDTSSVPVTTAFTIGGTSATASSVAISGSTATLTLSPAVGHDATITVSYTKPDSGGIKRSGKSIYADSFTALSVTNSTPDPTPKFASAVINNAGDALTITMSKKLLATTAGTPIKSAFAITGGTAAVTTVAVSGKTVSLTLSPKADHGETITIAYTKPKGANDGKLQSKTGGHIVASWTAQSATNNADGKPRPTSAMVNGATLAITFDRALDSASVPTKADFSINGTTASVSSASISGSTATLTLSATVAHDATITVNYVKPSVNGLKRSGKSIYADSFTALQVIDNTPAPPVVSSAVGNRSLITLTFSADLDDQSVPAASAFSLGTNQPGISTVAVSARTVSLTLAASLQEGTTYSLAYTVPQTKPLTSKDGVAVAAFTQDITNNTDVAPQATSATGDGATVTIAFDQALDSESAIVNTAFSMTAEPAATISSVSHGDNALSLTLSRALQEDETASLSYTQPDQDGIGDANGNRTASFTLAIDNQTDTAPVPVSGTVDEDEIVILLDQEIFEDPRFADGYPTDHFSLTGSETTIDSVAVSNDDQTGDGKIVIALASAVAEGASLSIRYFPSHGSIRIRDDDAGQNRAEINNYGLANLTDLAPVVESAGVDATVLTVTLDQSLDSDARPAASAFSLSNDGPAISSVAISGAELTLTLATSAVEDTDYTLTYTPPESNGLSDETGNAVGGFSRAVANTTDYAPFPISLTTDELGIHIYLRFDQRIDPSGTINPSWFSVQPSIEIKSVIIDSSRAEGDQLIIEFEDNKHIQEGATVTLTYTHPESGGLQDDDADNKVATFTKVVDNRVDVAPVVETMTVNGHKLTIEFDQGLNSSRVPPPSCEVSEKENPEVDCLKPGDFTWFTVERNKTSIVPIDSITVSTTTVSLHLRERIGRTDKVKIRYQPKSDDDRDRNLRDKSTPPHQVEGFTIPGEDYPDLIIETVTPAHPSSVSFVRTMPSQIAIMFDGPLPEQGLSLGSWLSVLAGQSVRKIDRNAIEDSTLLIFLSTPIPECVDVRVAYSSEDGDWVDGLGRAIDSFDEDVANLIDQDWKLECVESNFGSLDLTFAEAHVPSLDGWELTVNGKQRSIKVESGDKARTVTLIPTAPVCLGDAIEITHTGSAESFESTISAAAPCAVSAVTDRTTLTVTFDQPLDSALPTVADFALTGSSMAVAVQSIEEAVLTLKLTAPGLHIDEQPQLNYTGSTLKGGGLTVGAFELDVTIDPAPPKFKSAIGFQSWISIEFDQQLVPRSVSASRFVPIIPGFDDLKVLSVDISGASVLLELSHDLPDDEKLFAVLYLVGERGGLESVLGARVEDPVFIVENLTETVPTVESAVANGQAITVIFDQRIGTTDATASDFTVRAGRRTIAVTSLDWSDDSVEIGLAERVTSLDAVELIYEPATSGAVRDRSGLELKPFRYWADNHTPSPRTVQQKVDDAELRSSSSETTFARELTRGFATDDGLRGTAEPGEGWTRFARRGLTLSVDAATIGEQPARIYVRPLSQVASLLEHIETIPAVCWDRTNISGLSVWWIGQSDLDGVPSDIDIHLRVSGTDFAASPVPFCGLNLITGEWHLWRWHDNFVGPLLILKQSAPTPPIEAWWRLVR